MSEEPLIGEFGTFDVENYGDILYPIIFEKMLRRRGYAQPIHPFSLIGSDGLQGSGYVSRPIRELLSAPREASHALVVGGGDLLRTDWRRIASHYGFGHAGAEKSRAGSLLARLFPRHQRQAADLAARFKSEHLNYPSVGPFILNPDRFPSLASVAYCSCGVPFPFEHADRAQVADAFGKARFIYVRDVQSKQALAQAGVKREIHVGPDLIVKLSDFFDRTAEQEKGREILHRAGVRAAHPVLCVQSCGQSDEATDELVRQVEEYRRRTGCQVVLLPIGWCHGDFEFLQAVAHRARSKFILLSIRSVFETISVLAACNVFLGTSLHGNITAFSFGVPHLFGPIAVAKIGGFLEICGLPRELKLNSWAEIGQRLDWLSTLDANFFSAHAAAARRKVDATFNLFFQAVIGRRPGEAVCLTADTTGIDKSAFACQ